MFVESPGPTPGGSTRHYNYAQKVFQIGESSCLGIAMWGLGNLATTSYRTLIARFGDSLRTTPPTDVEDVAKRWSTQFWSAYSSDYEKLLQRAQELTGNPDRPEADENELNFLMANFGGGFCLGGCCGTDRMPRAFEIVYHLGVSQPPEPRSLVAGNANFWGCPNIKQRLLFGVDFGILEAIERHEKWSGSTDDLIQLVAPFRLAQPFDLPIREAIDWVYTSIYTTSQAMKFSHLAPVCGGPVEVAVVTTDRPFRWVRHKPLDAAILPLGPNHE